MYQVMTHHLYFFHVTLLLKHPPQIGDDYNQDLVFVKLDFIQSKDVNCHKNNLRASRKHGKPLPQGAST